MEKNRNSLTSLIGDDNTTLKNTNRNTKVNNIDNSTTDERYFGLRKITQKEVQIHAKISVEANEFIQKLTEEGFVKADVIDKAILLFKKEWQNQK